MGGEPPRAIKHPAVIGHGGLRAPVTAIGEVPGCIFITQTPRAQSNLHLRGSLIRQSTILEMTKLFSIIRFISKDVHTFKAMHGSGAIRRIGCVHEAP